jgi:hypothetical protein
MKRNGDGHYRLAFVVVALVILVPLLQWVRAQGRKAPIHMTTDWSNRHIVFSQPSSLPQSWRLNNEPRFNHQWLRRNARALQPKGQPPQSGSPANRDAIDQPSGGRVRNDIGDRPIGPFRPNRRRGPATDVQTIHADWGMSMQANGTTGIEMFPAKFSFDVSAAPDCVNDFVVFNTSLPGSAPANASRNGTFTGNAANAQTVTITNGTDSITLFANTGVLTTASGTVTTNGPQNNDTVTVGSITYRFRTVGNGLQIANDVLIGASNSLSARNLRAIIDAAIGECGSTTCFNTGTTTSPNPAVTHAVGNSTNVDTLTAPVDGVAGNFALASSNGGRLTIGGGLGTNGAGANDGLNFLTPGNNTTNATNLAAAIARNGAAVGVTSTSAVAVVTVTATSAGPDGNLITLAEGLNNFAWAVGPPTTLAGGAGEASIIAFNNIYSTQGNAGGFCNQDGPSVMWSYRTSTLGTPGGSVTSPVISGDGTKVAYVETSVSGAVLHLLKWKAGEGASVGDTAAPTTPLSAGQDWAANCPAGNSCIMNITFNGGAAAQDTNSSPFYNYNTDILYVGDNNGMLHKFTGVFLGAPAEVITAPWPMAVNGTANISSPVMDNGSGNIFMGDDSGRLSYVRETGSSTGTCNPGSNGGVVPCLGNATIQVGTGGAITDAPLVDGTAGTVLVANGTSTNAAAQRGTLVQASTSLATLTTLAIGGNANPGAAIHMGSFDNNYLNATVGSIPATAHFYICGKDNAFLDRPAIYQLGFSAAGVLNNSIGTPLTGLVSASGEACSPITEIENLNDPGGAKEWLFFSIGNLSNTVDPIPSGSPCRTDQAGCLISLDITSGVWPPSSALTATISLPANNTGSTSGIIVDNIADPLTSPEASSIYFTLGGNSVSGTGNPGLPQCNGHNGVGCAVKLTQAALQ